MSIPTSAVANFPKITEAEILYKFQNRKKIQKRKIQLITNG